VLPSQAYPVRGLCRLDAVQRHSQRQLGVRKFDRGEVLKGSEPLYQIGGRGAASFPGGGGPNRVRTPKAFLACTDTGRSHPGTSTSANDGTGSYLYMVEQKKICAFKPQLYFKH